MKYGLLLPHFGEAAGRDRLLQGARRAEELGFDSLWVRDHLIYEPHGEMERPDRTFYEALTTLTVVGTVTTRIGLGTAALIPFRHPLVLAQTVASMTHLVGPRLILGLGVGAFDHEFAAVGLGSVDRHSLLRAHVESLRRVMTENDVTPAAPIQFERVTIEPKPLGGVVPLWHCGTSPRSARGYRAVRWVDAGPHRDADAGAPAPDDRRAVAPRPGAAGPPWASPPTSVGRPEGSAGPRQHPGVAGVGQQVAVRGPARVGALRDRGRPRGRWSRARPTTSPPSAGSSRRSGSISWCSTSGFASTAGSSRSSDSARTSCLGSAHLAVGGTHR